MMITAWKKKQSFEITTSEFRKILMIEKKYPEFRLLAYNVLEPARKELEELALAGKSDCYFTYESYIGVQSIPKNLTRSHFM